MFGRHRHHHDFWRGEARGFGEHFARRGRGFGHHPLHGSGHGHDHGHRHGRGGAGRFFAHGDLKLVILNLIAEKPRHGYEIIKAIEDAVAGAYSPSPGVIYPTLTLLEELGYVTATPDGAKKLYTITDEGKAFLDANRATLDQLEERIGEAGQHRGGRSPAIMRAMHNLKTAMRLRLMSGPITDEQAEAIAAAIDEAAQKVEKAR